MTRQAIIYKHQKSESFISKLLNLVFGIAGIKNVLRKQLSNLDTFKNEPSAITKAVKKSCYVKEETFGGRTLWTLIPKNGTSNKAIYYIHGGAYVVHMSSLQWNYLAKIVEETQATIMVVNYPLAPQSNAEAAYHYMHELYQMFLERYNDKEVLFLGDSAGAGLAIAFAQYLNDVDLPQPSKIILSSPWLDVSMTNPEIKKVIPRDKALEITSLQKAGKLWAGNFDVKDPKVSPIYGRFDNIAKISMFIGTAEIFVSDVLKLVNKLKDENIPFDYYEYPNMFHCWLLFPPLPESKVALSQIWLN